MILNRSECPGLFDLIDEAMLITPSTGALYGSTMPFEAIQDIQCALDTVDITPRQDELWGLLEEWDNKLRPLL